MAIKTILTSPDGITWTPQSTPWDAGGGLQFGNFVASSPSLLVAVGDDFSFSGQTILTSPDAVTWTLRSNPLASFSVDGIAYGAGLFVATGPNGPSVVGSPLIASSPDGITWTPRYLDTSSVGSVESVCWTGTQFVAVGSNLTGLVANNCIMTSPDGITWTHQNDPLDGSCGEVAFGNGLIVGSRTQGVNAGSGNFGDLLTSPDGVTWTLQPTLTTKVVTSANYSSGAGLWVASVRGNAFAIQTSPDTVTWTSQSSPFDGVGGDVEYVVANSSLFVALGANSTGNVVMTSPDGVTWTMRSTPIDGPSSSLLGGTWDPTLGLFVAVGEGLLASTPGWFAGIPVQGSASGGAGWIVGLNP